MPEAERERLFTPLFFGVWCYSFITFFSAFQLLPAIPFRILELGGTKAQAGWFLAVYTFCSAFSGPLTGAIADHIGRRRMLIVASILFVGFSIAYGFVRALPLLLVIGAIHGSIWSGLLSASGAIMSEVIPESRRTEGLAYWGMASIAAFAIAPAAGLAMYHYGWLALCVELAVISVAMAIGALLLRVAETPPESRRPSLAAVCDWPVIRAGLTLTAISFGYGGITSYVAILSKERHITPISLYFTVFAIAMLVARIAFSHVADRHGVRFLLYPALACVPIAFATLAIATGRGVIIVSATLFGFGFGWAYPAFPSWARENPDARRRARTFGSILWAFDTGIGSGSILLGVLGGTRGLREGVFFGGALRLLRLS